MGKPILNGDVRTVDVKKEAEQRWTQDIQKQLKRTVFQNGGCNSWYFDKTGWNSTVLPYSQLWFWYWCQFPKWGDWNITYTRKGYAKLMLKRILKVSGVLFFLLGWYRARQEGGGLKSYLEQQKTKAISYSKLAALLTINQLRER